MDRQSVTVLHVDPDESNRERLAASIGSDDDLSVLGVGTVESALDRVRGESVDCIVAADALPDGTAFELFRKAREVDSAIGCVLFTEKRITDIDRSGAEDLVVEYVSKRIPGAEQRLQELLRSISLDRYQVGYPVPDDENARLEAVERYTMDELLSLPSFDRLLTLVQSHFDTDVAFIGIMYENEEQVIACRGEQLSILERETAIGTYAMLDDAVTVIEDVQSDLRFEHSERLGELGIRSYAGANLTTRDGYVIGELCLTNERPRSYGSDEQETLRLFATEIMEQLELRRRLPPGETTLNVGE